jgi:hypothetical protein
MGLTTGMSGKPGIPVVLATDGLRNMPSAMKQGVSM